jgi:GNAT superfamily N-acetyltransferase
MTMTTREAVAEDEAWLFQLHEDAHKELIEAAYGPWVPEQQQDFFRPLVDEHEVFVIESAGVSVGACYLGTREGDTWLELIEMTPSRQGEGLGAEALRWVVRQSEKTGRSTLLQVHRLNSGAKRLYEREGFAVTGETVTHYLLRHSSHNQH